MTQLNQYQINIAKAYTRTKQNIAIMARAGTGKTTTLQGLVRYIKHAGDFRLLAFTKSARDTMRQRMPKYAESIQTTYSLGFQTLAAHGHIKLDSRKLNKIIDANTDNFDSLKCLKTGYHMTKWDVYAIKDYTNLAMVSLATDYESVHSLVDVPGLEYRDWITTCVLRVLALSYEEYLDDGIICYSEMVSLPCLDPDIRPLQYTELLVDECQDLSVAQATLVKKSLRKGGQVVMVGDPAQSCFGFAGANYDSFDNMVQAFNAKVYPLPINYRCGLEIIKVAQQYCPDIQPMPNAHQGHVSERSQTWSIDYMAGHPEEPILVVCRLNAPLIKLAANLMPLGIQFNYARDILANKLSSNLGYLKTINKSPFGPEWFKETPDDNETTSDIKECLAALYGLYRPNTHKAMERSISKFFQASSKHSKLTLSTIHTAKGQESSTVFYWQPQLIPHPKADTDAKLTQEYNLDYVAKTRAIHNLYMVK